MVEVPSGLLDDVLAQAHTAAAAEPTPEPRVPWYRRVKWDMWGPGLAFAATAAVLLLVVRPASDDGAAVGSDAKVAQREPAAAPPTADTPAGGDADGRIADATPLAKAESDLDEEVARGEGLSDDGDAEAEGERRRDELAAADDKSIVAAEAQETADDALRLAQTRKEEKSRDYGGGLPGGGAGGGAVPSTGSTKSSGATVGGGKKMPAKPAPSTTEPAKKKGGSSKAGPMPAPNTAPKAEPSAPPPEPKPTAPKDNADDTGDQAWASVVTGDTRRNAGNCNGAKAAYQTAVGSPVDRTRARALAGLGLCALAAGDAKAAEAYFTKARKADASVTSFIDGERAKLEVDNAPAAAQEADE